MGKKRSSGGAGEELRGVGLSIRYVPLRDAALWDRNPKKHDLGGIIASVRAHGFRDAPIFDETLGAIVAGNGRTTALRHMQEGGEPAPAGVLVDGESGEWFVPMQFGINSGSREQAEAFGVDHNGLTVSGGDLGFVEVLGLFDRERIVPVLADAQRAGVQLATFDGDDLHAILHPPEPTPKPIGEIAADGVATVTCPNCGAEIPK